MLFLEKRLCRVENRGSEIPDSLEVRLQKAREADNEERVAAENQARERTILEKETVASINRELLKLGTKVKNTKPKAKQLGPTIENAEVATEIKIATALNPLKYTDSVKIVSFYQKYKDQQNIISASGVAYKISQARISIKSRERIIKKEQALKKSTNNDNALVLALKKLDSSNAGDIAKIIKLVQGDLPQWDPRRLNGLGFSPKEVENINYFGIRSDKTMYGKMATLIQEKDDISNGTVRQSPILPKKGVEKTSKIASVLPKKNLEFSPVEAEVKINFEKKLIAYLKEKNLELDSQEKADLQIVKSMSDTQMMNLSAKDFDRYLSLLSKAEKGINGIRMQYASRKEQVLPGEETMIDSYGGGNNLESNKSARLRLIKARRKAGAVAARAVAARNAKKSKKSAPAKPAKSSNTDPSRLARQKVAAKRIAAEAQNREVEKVRLADQNRRAKEAQQKAESAQVRFNEKEQARQSQERAQAQQKSAEAKRAEAKRIAAKAKASQKSGITTLTAEKKPKNPSAIKPKAAQTVPSREEAATPKLPIKRVEPKIPRQPLIEKTPSTASLQEPQSFPTAATSKALPVTETQRTSLPIPDSRVEVNAQSTSLVNTEGEAVAVSTLAKEENRAKNEQNIFQLETNESARRQVVKKMAEQQRVVMPVNEKPPEVQRDLNQLSAMSVLIGNTTRIVESISIPKNELIEQLASSKDLSIEAFYKEIIVQAQERAKNAREAANKHKNNTEEIEIENYEGPEATVRITVAKAFQNNAEIAESWFKRVQTNKENMLSYIILTASSKDLIDIGEASITSHAQSENVSAEILDGRLKNFQSSVFGTRGNLPKRTQIWTDAYEISKKEGVSFGDALDISVDENNSQYDKKYLTKAADNIEEEISRIDSLYESGAKYYDQAFAAYYNSIPGGKEAGLGKILTNDEKTELTEYEQNQYAQLQTDLGIEHGLLMKTDEGVPYVPIEGGKIYLPSGKNESYAVELELLGADPVVVLADNPEDIEANTEKMIAEIAVDKLNISKWFSSPSQMESFVQFCMNEKHTGSIKTKMDRYQENKKLSSLGDAIRGIAFHLSIVGGISFPPALFTSSNPQSMLTGNDIDGKDTAQMQALGIMKKGGTKMEPSGTKNFQGMCRYVSSIPSNRRFRTTNDLKSYIQIQSLKKDSNVKKLKDKTNAGDYSIEIGGEIITASAEWFGSGKGGGNQKDEDSATSLDVAGYQKSTKSQIKEEYAILLSAFQKDYALLKGSARTERLALFRKDEAELKKKFENSKNLTKFA